VREVGAQAPQHGALRERQRLAERLPRIQRLRSVPGVGALFQWGARTAEQPLDEREDGGAVEQDRSPEIARRLEAHEEARSLRGRGQRTVSREHGVTEHEASALAGQKRHRAAQLSAKWGSDLGQ
jgi:hypothetical protein